MSRCKLRNKKGQTGETISWIVATLVIIGILLIFIWISVLMSKVKIVKIGDVKTDLPKEPQSLNVKTALAHKIANGKNKEVIDNILKENDK
jgi:TRAP-type mannitol/chloroaromatic compound transport system permease small subunit